MGGKDWLDGDWSTGRECAQIYPAITALWSAARQFQVDAVRGLAARGVRQFLEVGVGLPGPRNRNTHEVAQAVHPDARVVYVDDDPVVLSHARALLTPVTAEGHVEVVAAGVGDSDRIVAAADRVLDWREPVAVLLCGALGLVADWGKARRVVSTVMGALAPGSWLVWWDGTDTDPRAVTMWQHYSLSAPSYEPRDPDQLRDLFDGLVLETDDLVPLYESRSPSTGFGPGTPLAAVCAIARKPAETVW